MESYYRGGETEPEGTDTPAADLRASEERFNNLVALSSSCYWEQDADHRFSAIRGTLYEQIGVPSESLLGTRLWDHPTAPLSGNWEEHQVVLRAHRPFSEFMYRHPDAQGEQHYLCVSGQPRFGNDGAFKGYCGTVQDVTERVQSERRMTIEHTAARVLGESHDISEATPHLLRVICQTLGWSCGVRWEVDPEGGLLDCAETWDNGEAAVGGFLASLCELVGPSLKAHLDTTWIPDLSQAPEFPGAAQASSAGLNAFFSFPIRSGSQTMGVLVFFSSEISRPDAELLECAAYLGQQVGQFWQRTVADVQLREIGERFQNMTELSSDWYWELNADCRFTLDAGNDQYDATFGRDLVIGKVFWELPFIDVSEEQWESFKTTLTERQPFHDLLFRRKAADNSICYVNLSGRPFFDDHGQFKGYRGIGKDVTEQKSAEQHVRYLASHDSLTTLPNRTMFSEVLHVAIETARRYNRSFALLFLDLDRFKNINDTFGHEAGDVLLQEISQRVLHTLRASDIVARLGGDEFVILLQEVATQKHVAAVARKLLDAIVKPVMLLKQECRVTASIGICLYPTDAEDEQTLMKNADIAMYRAKEEGRNTYQFYSEQLNMHSLERLALETSLRRAIEREEFFLEYQPKLDLELDCITGAEALLRWRHPDLGVVAPAQFIPMAEETGLIVPIGRWVLRTACEQNITWQREGMAPLCMAVNLSPRQFTDEHLLQDIAKTLKQTGMRPELLELEITESMVVHDFDRARDLLSAIKAMGVRLAMDDFGAGYFSLAQIKHFPLDTLKVDRSFIRDIPADGEDKAITEAIIAMGKTLSLTVVAEGVETEEQQRFLRERACHQMQGYYFSRAVDAAQFAALVQRQGVVVSGETAVVETSV